MADYELLYWSVPFRGQFVRAVLAQAGATWTEGGDEKIAKLMDGPIADTPVPFMGPPVLIDHKAEVAIAEMPAIILYLGETLDLLPDTPELRAMTLKIVNDANDVIDELTLDGGRQMWTRKRWEAFEPRLRKWMSFWEETGRRHGLKKTSGFLLGEDEPGALRPAEQRHEHRRLLLAVGVHRRRLLRVEQEVAEARRHAQMITWTVPPSTLQAAPAT